jgi:hypothetical protein
MNADFPLPPLWQGWVMDNLVANIAHERIIETLIDKGLSETAARREVALVAASYARQLNAYVRMLRALRGLDDALPTATTLGSEDFWSNHWEANRPLLLKGYASDWPAMSRWSFEAWRTEQAALPVRIEIDRDPNRHWEGRQVDTTLGEFLSGIDTSPNAEPRNDIYCIAKSRNAARPAWQALYADLRPDPALFDDSRQAGGTSLWIGPRGTLTPLHYDTTNIFFCQVVGRKQFELIAPHTTELWPRLEGFYVRGDLEGVAASTPVLRATLEPGDVLFIPAGWFHRVTALDAAISYSLLNFRRPNGFDSFALQRLAAPPRIHRAEF